jgi:hypothetical protein
MSNVELRSTALVKADEDGNLTFSLIIPQAVWVARSKQAQARSILTLGGLCGEKIRTMQILTGLHVEAKALALECVKYMARTAFGVEYKAA